ncbi:ATPase [Citricoccus sp.]|uniref:AAA family ATPase n=1 Tax=Citricoccus sp. TaxID=1978372 RepID=UPI002BFB5A04|nr:ATPase [Citricoccus sp.]HRO93112.1 ATPase [Citricoccus sp.]
MRKVSVATTIMPGHDHVSGLERLRGPVTVIRRCESLAELISVARSGLADVLLVAGDTGQLTLTFLDSVAADARGRRVAVVALSDVAAERERLGHLGVVAVPPETPPSDLAALLQEAVAAARHPLPVGSSDHDDRPPGATERPGRRAAGAIVRTGSSGSAAPGTRPAEARAGAVDPGAGQDSAAAPVSSGEWIPASGEDDDDGDRSGARSAAPVAVPVPPADVLTDSEAGARPTRTTAVWGPAGSPGRTTVAVNLSVELALAGRRTLLVDLDTYAASAGVLLGLLDESAGIAQACRLADQGEISAEGVGRCALRARVAGATLQVLTGLTRSDRWPELRRSALDAVLTAAAEGWEEVVIDCGFSLEQDEELSFDIPAPQRNAATLAGLAAADRILAVGAGDPVGLPRLVRALDELDQAETAAGAVVEIVVNQVRAEASGVAPRSQVRSVLEHFAGDRTVSAFLPWDRKALDRALLGGQVLAEAAPKSALRRALSALAGTPQEPAEGRARRLPVPRRLLGAAR